MATPLPLVIDTLSLKNVRVCNNISSYKEYYLSVSIHCYGPIVEAKDLNDENRFLSNNVEVGEDDDVDDGEVDKYEDGNEDNYLTVKSLQKSVSTASLIIMDSHNKPDKEFLIPNGLSFGRDPNCHVRIQVNHVSRLHATISNMNDQFSIHHLSKTNPTFINNESISSSRLLKHGDIIMIGEKSFLFQTVVNNNNNNDNNNNNGSSDELEEKKNPLTLDIDHIHESYEENFNIEEKLDSVEKDSDHNQDRKKVGFLDKLDLEGMESISPIKRVRDMLRRLNSTTPTTSSDVRSRVESSVKKFPLDHPVETSSSYSRYQQILTGLGKSFHVSMNKESSLLSSSSTSPSKIQQKSSSSPPPHLQLSPKLKLMNLTESEILGDHSIMSPLSSDRTCSSRSSKSTRLSLTNKEMKDRVRFTNSVYDDIIQENNYENDFHSENFIFSDDDVKISMDDEENKMKNSKQDKNRIQSIWGILRMMNCRRVSSSTLEVPEL